MALSPAAESVRKEAANLAQTMVWTLKSPNSAEIAENLVLKSYLTGKLQELKSLISLL